MVLDSVVVFDNPVSILPFIIRPEPAKHLLVEKTFTLKNSLIGGLSDTFNCAHIGKSFRYKGVGLVIYIFFDNLLLFNTKPFGKKKRGV